MRPDAHALVNGGLNVEMQALQVGGDVGNPADQPDLVLQGERRNKRLQLVTQRAVACNGNIEPVVNVRIFRADAIHRADEKVVVLLRMKAAGAANPERARSLPAWNRCGRNGGVEYRPGDDPVFLDAHRIFKVERDVVRVGNPQLAATLVSADVRLRIGAVLPAHDGNTEHPGNDLADTRRLAQ